MQLFCILKNLYFCPLAIPLSQRTYRTKCRPKFERISLNLWCWICGLLEGDFYCIKFISFTSRDWILHLEYTTHNCIKLAKTITQLHLYKLHFWQLNSRNCDFLRLGTNINFTHTDTKPCEHTCTRPLPL